MKIALLCSGLGRVVRGHEVFADDLFELLGDSVDVTLLKGGGMASARQWVIDNLPRNSDLLRDIHVCVAPKWADAVREQERTRIEAETFAYASLKPLLSGGFDIVHCLEMEVCNILHDQRHLFAKTPKIVFSNGGAIPARYLPRCDFVQEHTERNLAYSARGKAFMIPHGIDLGRFDPATAHPDLRTTLGIPADAFLVISVGTIGRTHKRMHHVISELAPLAHVHLLVVGQESAETPSVKALGREAMGDRVHFATLPHEQLPAAYSAADAFVLGSVFETFGIVYIEAMAMGLPVICTDHPNQRSIVKQGIFIDMAKPGALTQVLRSPDRDALRALGRSGRAVVEAHYDLRALKAEYLRRYAAIAATPSSLPRYSWRTKLASNLRSTARRSMQWIGGRAE